MTEPEEGGEQERGPVDALNDMAHDALLEFLKSATETLEAAIERHGAEESSTENER